MTSKEKILSAIRAAAVPESPMPDLSFDDALSFANPLEAFSETLAAVGGRAVLLSEGESIREKVLELFPDAGRIASNLPEMEGVGFNPDLLDNPALLDGTDLAVVRGSFGVAENAAVWMELSVRHRALYFISDALVIVLDRNALVDNMHEAYRRIAGESRKWGAFISGPSKTADIEQALVFGAHGAAELVVLLV